MAVGAVPYPFTTSGIVGPTNASGFVEIHGLTLRETGGATALVCTLREGSSTGPIVGEFGIPISGSLGNGFLPKIKVHGSVYVAVSGGTASGVLYVQ